MSKRVKISVIGAAPLSEDRGTGRAAVDRMIEHWRHKLGLVLPDRPDLIVVPECCDRYAGWSADQAREYYSVRGDLVRDMFSEVAARHSCAIAYAAVRAVPGDASGSTWRNSIQLIGRNGLVAGVYDKNYPTIGEMEEVGIRPGSEAPIVECDLGEAGTCRVACAICFDLNFDELRIQYVAAKPELVLFSSMYHGGLMQAYWAYSCRAHLASAISGLESRLIDPPGRVVASTTNYFDHVTATVNLDCCLVHLDYHWEKLEALKRAYGPDVSISDPGYLGPVLVSSETPARTAEQMLTAFGIEPLDDYMERARSVRQAHSGPERRGQ